MSYFYSLTYTLQNKPYGEHLPVLEKRCSICRKIKPRDDFAKYISGAGGITSQCKECLNSRAMEKKRQKKNDYAFQ